MSCFGRAWFIAALLAVNVGDRDGIDRYVVIAAAIFWAALALLETVRYLRART